MPELLRVRAYNFLSFPFFELDLSKRGLLRIIGTNLDDELADSNDSGKTNMINSITWGAYEKLAKLGNDRVGDEVVNSKAKKNCQVDQLWRGDDGKIYQVSRYRKHEQYGNKVFFISLSGKKIQWTAEGRREATNEEIEKLIGMSYPLFMRSVFWAQGTSTKRLTQLTDVEYKALFDELIGTDYYVSKLKAAQKEMTTADAKKAVLTSEIAGVRGRIAALREELHHYLSSSSRTCLSQMSATKLVEVQTLIKKWRVFEEELAITRTNLSGLNTRIEHTKIKHCNAVEKGKQLVAVLNSLTVKMVEKMCSQCGQVLESPDAVAKVESRRASLSADIEEQRMVVRSLASEGNNLVKEHGRLAAVVVDLERKIQAASDVYYANLPEGMKDLPPQGFLDAVSKSSESKEQVARLKDQIESLEKDIILKDNGIKDTEKMYSKYAILERAFGPAGLRTLRLQKLNDPLNITARKYSELLSGGAIRVKFSTTTALKSGEIREKYKVSFEKDEGIDFKLSGGGMTRRADLIAAFAFEDIACALISRSINIRVYDEATEGLDASGEQTVVETLRADPTDTKIFITQRSLVSDNWFDGTLNVARKNNVSTLVQ